MDKQEQGVPLRWQYALFLFTSFYIRFDFCSSLSTMTATSARVILAIGDIVVSLVPDIISVLRQAAMLSFAQPEATAPSENLLRSRLVSTFGFPKILRRHRTKESAELRRQIFRQTKQKPQQMQASLRFRR